MPATRTIDPPALPISCAIIVARERPMMPLHSLAGPPGPTMRLIIPKDTLARRALMIV